MELQLIRWRYKGIRGGLSDLEIELGDPPPRWSLIQMPNGTGKTTTMALLRAALSGRPPSADEVRAFRANDDVRSGEFELTLKIDSQLVRVLLKLDFEKGEMTYKTARARRTGG